MMKTVVTFWFACRCIRRSCRRKYRRKPL